MLAVSKTHVKHIQPIFFLNTITKVAILYKFAWFKNNYLLKKIDRMDQNIHNLPEWRPPPKGCWPTTEPVDLSFM